MSPTLLAANCPAIQVPAAMLSLALAYSTPGGNAPTARTFSAGDTTTVGPKLNANASRLDLAGRYGGGAYAVAWGLALSVPGSGLALPVAAGHALVDGPVEIASATTVTVPNGSPRVWIWLTQAGALTAVNNSLTPPAGAVCLLGSCVTSGGNVTSVDTSGVLYMRGGVPWRQTADTGAPGDTPPAGMVFVARTLGGLYLWDGQAYSAIGAEAGVFDAIAAANTFTVPAGRQVSLFDQLAVNGTLTINGKVRVTI